MKTQTSPIWSRRQRGIALIFALILLVVITLLGLGAMRGTTLMQKIMANFYDRESAFQAAEAGLNAGAQALAAGTSNIRNCGPGGVVCPSNPFTDNTASGNIATVASSVFSSIIQSSGPQYIIENIGTWPDPDKNYNQGASATSYAPANNTPTSVYYRISARSSDPSGIGDRAVVTLQAMYKQ